MGVLSVNGRRKVVVGLDETVLAIKELLKDSKIDTYNVQVACMLLIILYSGIRLSSLVPGEKCFEHEWKYLKWKVSLFTKENCYYIIKLLTTNHQHVTIYREGRDSRGDCFVLRTDFQHIKCKENVLNTADHMFARSFTSSLNCFNDLPSLFISFLISRNYLSEEFSEWYMSGSLTLKIKPEVLELPVFCRNERGG